MLALAAGWRLSAQTGSATSENQDVDVEHVRQSRDATAADERARGCFDRKDFEGARKVLGLCFQRIPAYPDAHFLLAKVLDIEKDYAQALKDLERARDGHPILAMSLASVQEARPSEMRTRIRESSDLATAPNELPAEHSLFHGNVLLRLGRTAEAEAQYEEASSARADDSDAAHDLAALYVGERRYEKAFAVVSKAEASGATINPERKKVIEAGLRQGGQAQGPLARGAAVVEAGRRGPSIAFPLLY